MENVWIVGFDDAKKRLDVFLTEKIPHATRSAIAKELKNGAGSINGKTASVHTFLKEGDSVSFEPMARASVRKSDTGSDSPKRTQNTRHLGLTDRNAIGPSDHVPAAPKIIKETPDWIVLDKPAGMLVHPTANEETDTLVDWLVAHHPPLAKVGEDPTRPGIMHRLDREVSGLMVVAKTQDAFDALKRQFATHSTGKTYVALVYGHPPKDQGDIKFKIARSSRGGRMAARPESDEGGKAAWTHYSTVRNFKTATLLELNILSGRTHQIRAHLFALGCPVVGDNLYLRKDIKPIKTDRMLLQAVKLEFDDPTTGERQYFELPTDKEFDRVTAKLTE